jgi:hypothetical protein
MTINSLSFAAPVRKVVRTPPLDYELLERAVEQFNAGQFAEALETVLRHLFPGRDVPEGPAGTFTFPQGSSRVTLRWDAQGLKVSVPLVRLPTGGRATAALRFLLTQVSGTGQLHQPRLRGEEVHLEFEDRLSRLHPLKLLEVLQQAPVQADRYDDWMVDQFGAAPLEREPITPLDADELARAEEIWHTHWNEVEELVKETQRKRSIFFLNEVTAYAFFRLRQALPLSGSLSTRLDESAGTFNHTDQDPDKRLAVLLKCAKEMRSVPVDELSRNMGHARYSISPLGEGTGKCLKHYLAPGEYLDGVDEARRSGQLIDAAIALFSTFHFLLARWSWPEPIEALLQDGIARASDKPWREAATILRDQGIAVVARYDEEGYEDEDEEEEEEEEEEEWSAASGSDEDAEVNA